MIGLLCLALTLLLSLLLNLNAMLLVLVSLPVFFLYSTHLKRQECSDRLRVRAQDFLGLTGYPLDSRVADRVLRDNGLHSRASVRNHA